MIENYFNPDNNEGTNEGWADAMAKILQKQLPEDKVLCHSHGGLLVNRLESKDSTIHRFTGKYFDLYNTFLQGQR